MTEPRNFWSDRKAAVKAEEVAEVQSRLDQDAEADKIALEEKDDADILTELNLPDPDALALGDDVSGFMSKAVPDRLRRRALRKLWRLNPILANIDGLVDYGEDFTDSAMVIEDLQTTYQVGKGMLAHVREMARQAEEKDRAEPSDMIGESDLDLTDDTIADAEISPETSPALSAQPPEPVEPAKEIAEYTAEQTLPTPRRMRFEFET